MDCDPIEKLLFLYFLTNPLTSICGAYEIRVKRIAFDTGIDQDMVLKILDRFAQADKIYYVNNWIVIKNFVKHQNVNPNIQKGIENQLNNLPEEVLQVLNSNTNSNSNIKAPFQSLSKASKGFTPPLPQVVQEYLNSENITTFTGDQFCDFYASKGWMVGKNKMKDWQAAVRTWKRNHAKDPKKQTAKEIYG